jgi:Rrf2 family protein
VSSILRISEAASLAFHALALLVKQEDKKITTHLIAERLAASEHTVSKVMQSLTKSGLVKSVRGPKGGFYLSRNPEEISLSDIYNAVEIPLVNPDCLISGADCQQSGCILGGLVKEIHEKVVTKFNETTLQQLADNVSL